MKSKINTKIVKVISDETISLTLNKSEALVLAAIIGHTGNETKYNDYAIFESLYDFIGASAYHIYAGEIVSRGTLDINSEFVSPFDN